MDSARPFRAFVSYCHADAAFAARLQRRLEGYRLPRRLADRVAPLPGQASGRIGPIFRDRADLSAAEDLSAAVREAIAASSALVVVASPDAAGSRWVALEIRLFRELHPGAPVLVALARGEPEAALPEALRVEGIEPLAADFRREGDGKRLAFLKIVAGLTGIPFDALVQRDAQRQLRRVMAITLGALALAVLMAALLVVTLRSQAEAEQRRSDVEGIIEFMDTDLRRELKGVGDLRVMRAVNERALKYFDSQGDPKRLSDESVLLRAQVLHALGEDEVNGGDLVGGTARFDDAYRTTAAVLARHPGDAKAIFAHAQSEFWSGVAAWGRGDRAVTTRHWRAYLDRTHALAGVEPGSVRSLMEQGYAVGQLCELNHADRYDEKAAARDCAVAIRFEEAALAAQIHVLERTSADRREPEQAALRGIKQDLANRHGWMARVHLALGDTRGALASRDRESALLDELIKRDPASIEWALRRSWSDIGKADAWIKAGKPDRAEQVLRDCLDRQWKLFVKSSGDERVIETQFRLHLFLAKALHLGGRPYAQVLATADGFGTALAALGEESARKARKIRTAIWS